MSVHEHNAFRVRDRRDAVRRAISEPNEVGFARQSLNVGARAREQMPSRVVDSVSRRKSLQGRDRVAFRRHGVRDDLEIRQIAKSGKQRTKVPSRGWADVATFGEKEL